MVLCIMRSYEHKIREHLPGTGKNPGCGTGCGAATKLDWKREVGVGWGKCYI